LDILVKGHKTQTERMNSGELTLQHGKCSYINVLYPLTKSLKSTKRVDFKYYCLQKCEVMDILISLI
jgi:hypothetical protein